MKQNWTRAVVEKLRAA